MSARQRQGAAREGSILLPVIVVLLLIASAATAMTLQVRTSLREAAIRRDRMALGFMADAVVRTAALALGEALAARAQPPFELDGTPQTCVLPGGGRLVLAVQDEGGLVDLNKASGDLLLLLVQRAGLSGWDAKAATDAILRRRDSAGGPAGSNRAPMPGQHDFRTVDEIDGLPGMTREVFDRLVPALSVQNGSAGLDPAIAGPGLRALISPKELTGPGFADRLTPSSRNAFTITGTAVSGHGMRARRQASLDVPTNGSQPRFTSWDAPISLEPFAGMAGGAFCVRVAAALGAA